MGIRPAPIVEHIRIAELHLKHVAHTYVPIATVIRTIPDQGL